MAVKKLQLKPQVYDFQIPEPYTSDYWDFENFDYYKNSSEENKKLWLVRGHTNKNYIDFTKCKNECIREEIKFYIYNLLEINKVNLYTLSNYWCRIVSIMDFANEKLISYTSLTEEGIIPMYTDFLIKTNKKIVAKQGVRILNTFEVKEVYGKSDYLTRLESLIALLKSTYDTRPELEKDIWEIAKLPYDIKINESAPIKTINFSLIEQKQIRELAKEYVKFRIRNISLNTIHGFLSAINCFSRWLSSNHPEITLLSQINREIIEEYIGWLKTSSGLTASNYCSQLGNISTFLDYLRLMNLKDVPQIKLLDKNDYKIKTKKEVKPYSDEEMKAINTNLCYLENPQHARMIFVLQFVGCRINELCELKPSDLIEGENGYSLKLHERKNLNISTIPIDDEVAEVLKSAIACSKETFGEDVKYIFAKNKTQCISRTSLTRNLRKIVIDREIKADTGKFLNITFHRFRTTLSCKYMEQGLSADVISLLLGHKVKETLKSYAKVSNPEMKKAMKPRLDKFDLLIENIGHVSEIKESLNTCKEKVALPNGFCNKPLDTGICDHANFCLGCSLFQPDIRYLLGYKLQLRDVEETITKLKDSDNERALQYNIDLKDKLTQIIEKLEGKKNEKI